MDTSRKEKILLNPKFVSYLLPPVHTVHVNPVFLQPANKTPHTTGPVHISAVSEIRDDQEPTQNISLSNTLVNNHINKPLPHCSALLSSVHGTDHSSVQNMCKHRSKSDVLSCNNLPSSQNVAQLCQNMNNNQVDMNKPSSLNNEPCNTHQHPFYSNYYINPKFSETKLQSSSSLNVQCKSMGKNDILEEILPYSELNIPFKNKNVQKPGNYYVNPKFLNNSENIASGENSMSNKGVRSCTHEPDLNFQQHIKFPAAEATAQQEKSLTGVNLGSEVKLDINLCVLETKYDKLVCAKARPPVSCSSMFTTQNTKQLLPSPNLVANVVPHYKSPPLFMNKTKLVRTAKYGAKNKLDVIKKLPSISTKDSSRIWIKRSNQLIVNSTIKQQKPVIFVTKNKLIRKRSNSSILNTGSSPTMIRASATVKSKNKCSQNNYHCLKGTSKDSPGFQRTYNIEAVTSNKLAASHRYSWLNSDARSKGRNCFSTFHMRSHNESFSSHRSKSLISKSDRYVKIGHAMYKSTTSSLKRQSPQKLTQQRLSNGECSLYLMRLILIKIITLFNMIKIIALNVSLYF